MIINALNGAYSHGADTGFAKKLDFKDIRFPVKVRDIYKTEKNNSIGIRF